MREVSPLLLDVARKRVACGVRWLDEKAKTDIRFIGWRIQMMWIIRGRVVSLVKMYNNTDDPLSLILKWNSDLASPFDGRVKWATVAPAFGFTSDQGRLKALYLGFWEGNTGSSWYESREVLDYSYALNQAWEEALGEHRMMLSPDVYKPTIKVRRIRISLLGAFLGWWGQRPSFG